MQLNTLVADSFNRTWNYKSSSNSSLLSFAVSVSLQSATIPDELTNNVKNNLNMNASSIIPFRYVLTNEGFMVLAFQPNCKYIHITSNCTTSS